MEDNIYDNIIPFSAAARMVVEEGQVNAVIDGYLFSFTIHEYSNGSKKLMLDSDTPKARKILKKFGVSFARATLDEIHGDEFIAAVHKIYQLSNSEGGSSCSWITDKEVDYKEFS